MVIDGMASEKRCRYSTPWWKLKLPSDEPPFCVPRDEENLWKSLLPPSAHQAGRQGKSAAKSHVSGPALDLRLVRRARENIEGREENIAVPDDSGDFQDQIVPTVDREMEKDGNAAMAGHKVEDQEAQRAEEANNVSRVGHVIEDQLQNRMEEANAPAGIRSESEQQSQSSRTGNNWAGSVYRIIEILKPPLAGISNSRRVGYFIQNVSQTIEQANSRAGKRHGWLQPGEQMEGVNNKGDVSFYFLEKQTVEGEDDRPCGMVVSVSHHTHKERNEVAARIGFVKNRAVLMVEANNSAGVILEGVELLTLDMDEVNNGVRFKGVELQVLHIDESKIGTLSRRNLLDQRGGLILAAKDGNAPRHCPAEQDQQTRSVIEGHSGTATNRRIEKQPSKTVEISINRSSVWYVTFLQWEQFVQKAVALGVASPTMLEKIRQSVVKLRIEECCIKHIKRSVVMAGNVVDILQSVKDANNRTDTRLVASDLRERPVEETTSRAGATQELVVDQQVQPMEGVDNRASTRYGSIEHQAQPVDGVNNENRTRQNQRTQAMEDTNNGTGTGNIIVQQQSQPRDGSSSRTSAREVLQQGGQLVQEANDRPDSVSRVLGQRKQRVRGTAVGDFSCDDSIWALIVGADTGEPTQETNNSTGPRQEVLEQQVQPMGEANNIAGDRQGVVNQQAQSMEDVTNRADVRYCQVEHQAELPGEVNNDNCNRQSAMEQNTQNVQVSNIAVHHMIGASSGTSTNENVEGQPPQLIQGANNVSGGRFRILDQQVLAVAGGSIRASSVGRSGEQCVQPMEGARTRHRDEEQRSQAMTGVMNSTFARPGAVEQIVQPAQRHSNENGDRRREREHRSPPMHASNLARARQGVLQQGTQYRSMGSDRPGIRRTIRMDEDNCQLPDSTVDEDGVSNVEHSRARMHWLCTYTDNEAEGVVLRDVCPLQQNRPRANEAVFARELHYMTLCSGSAQADFAARPGCSFWPANTAEPNRSSRSDYSAQILNTREQLNVTQPGASTQSNSSTLPVASAGPSSSSQTAVSVQRSVPTILGCSPQLSSSSKREDSVRSAQPGGSAQLDGSAQSSSSAQPDVSVLPGGSSLRHGSSNPGGPARSFVPSQTGISARQVQPGGPSPSSGSSVPDISVQPGGSSQPGGSAQSHGSSNPGGPAWSCVSSQPGVSAQPGGSAQPAASSQSSGLSQPDVSVHPGGSTQCHPSEGYSGSDESSDFDEPGGSVRYTGSSHPRLLAHATKLFHAAGSASPDGSETSESETSDWEDFPLLTSRDSVDFNVKPVFCCDEIELTSKIFKLKSVPHDADIGLYVPTRDESDEEEEEVNRKHPTRGQVPDDKELNVQHDMPKTKGRSRKKKAPVKNKSKVQRKKRRKM